MNRIKTVFLLCMLMAGVAQATLINIAGANGEFGNVDVGTMAMYLNGEPFSSN